MNLAARPPLHAADHGAGEPALVFLHHFAGSGEAWADVIEAIGPARRCLALDLRGFGRSQEGAPTSVADAAVDIVGAVQKAGVVRFILVGHSMGGKFAWAVAAARPPGLLGVVLASPSPPTPEPMTEEDRRERLGAFGDRQASTRLAGKISVRSLSKPSLETFVGASLKTSEAAWRGWLLCGSKEDISDLAWPAGLPALAISGHFDTTITPRTVQNEVVARIAGSRLEVIADAGHLLPYETPSALALSIIRFGREIDNLLAS